MYPVFEIIRYGTIALVREFVWIRKRLNQLTKLIPLSSAITVMVRPRAPTVDIFLTHASCICRVRPRSTDLACLEKVFVNEEYRLPFTMDPRIIVDAGANIGAASIYFAHKYPNAKVFALEPEESNFALLKYNCSHLSNVVPIRAALWSKSEKLTLVDPGSEKWAFSVRSSAGDEATIDGIAVDDLMEQWGIDSIDILKLDIEGTEKDIFSAPAIAWLGHVNVIAIELHDRFSPGCSQAFYSALQGRSFSQEVNGENVFIRLIHDAVVLT